MKRPDSQIGHVLIVVMVFLMLSSLLIVNGLEVLKEDRLSIIDFEAGIQDRKNH